MKFIHILLGMSFLLMTHTVQAQESGFSTGPVFTDFGPSVLIDHDMTIPEGTAFKVAFDVTVPAGKGKINKTLESAARFINMHARAGVPIEDIHVAVIVHSKAAYDLTKDAYYSGKYEGAKNGSAAAIAALTNGNVRVILCGQTAAYHGISKSDLLPGVEMALSAMTAHALLQQDGYTLNPF